KAQLDGLHELSVQTSPGISCQRKFVPIDRVRRYIPGRTAPLVSSVLMMAIPAKLAGCNEIIMCSPPIKNGGISREVLAALCASGANALVFAIGGAQAIAAMGYGTQSIPKVSKIFGPGNQWV